MKLYERPGQLTDLQQWGDPDGKPITVPQLVLDGYEWLSFQAWNPHPSLPQTQWLHNFDLAAIMSHGIEAGVWGVSYDVGSFHRDGRILAQQAVKLGAKHLIADIEQALKGTRSARAGKAFIDGCREGGWAGPVHLTTFGNPTDPLRFDFEMDLLSFLETGGGLLPQCYPADGLEYTVANALAYWSRPEINPCPERINALISVASGPNGRRDGPANAALLKEVGDRVQRNVSLYMTQYARRSDIAALYPWTKLDPFKVRTQVAELTGAWLKQQTGTQPKSRMRVMNRIAGTGNPDPIWTKADDTIVAALNDAGVPAT